MSKWKMAHVIFVRTQEMDYRTGWSGAKLDAMGLTIDRALTWKSKGKHKYYS